MRKRLLVDACCGPCVMTALRKLGMAREQLLFLFFNPNIHPFSEYERRLGAFRKVMEREATDFEVLPYRPEEWMRAVAFKEESRCEVCYRLRLERAADMAREKSVESFTTTLLASPYQDHGLIIDIGNSMAEERGLLFVSWDGREVYREVLGEARRSGIYTQPYCGCLFSERERYDPPYRRGSRDRKASQSGT